MHPRIQFFSVYRIVYVVGHVYKIAHAGGQFPCKRHALLKNKVRRMFPLVPEAIQNEAIEVPDAVFCSFVHRLHIGNIRHIANPVSVTPPQVAVRNGYRRYDRIEKRKRSLHGVQTQTRYSAADKGFRRKNVAKHALDGFHGLR